MSPLVEMLLFLFHTSTGLLKREINTYCIRRSRNVTTMLKRDKLKCTWTFWEDQWGVDPSSGGTKQCLTHLGDADNVKDFYVLLNRHGITTVPANASLHIFRKHVRPEWEDKHNIDGGHLRVFSNIQKGESPEVTSKRLSCLWFDVLRSIIGEHFKDSDQVVGVGYTHKPHRPIMSVWLSSTDAEVTGSIRKEIFELFSVSGNALFTARFYSHKGLAKSETDVIHDRVHWHRRIQSAPEKSYVSIGDEDEEGNHSDNSAKSEDLQVSSSEFEIGEATEVPLAGKKPSSFRGKGRSQPAEANTASGDVPLGNKASPTLLSRRGVTLSSASINREHLHSRSRTETSAAEAITAQPIKIPSLAESQQNSEGGSGIHVPSVAPTPIKDWTLDWSPSAFTAAQSQRSGNFSAVRASAATNTFVTAVPAPDKVRAMPPRAIGVTPDFQSHRPSPHVQQAKTAPRGAPLPVAPSPSVSVAASKPMIVDPNQLSDRKPFVCRGTVFPARMNRKDYRAIVFNQPNAPTPYEGSFAAPPDAPDGDLSQEEFERLRDLVLQKALDVN
jgi:hypothetical protein